MANRTEIVEKVRRTAERVAASEGLEIVEVQLLGGGSQRVLRIFIDRAEPAREAESGDRAGAPAAQASAQSATMTPAAATPAPAGVTHADCEFISQQVGTILDVEDVIPGGRYTLEVSSPGLERKLSRPRDFERFTGRKIRVMLRQPVENQRRWSGTLAGFDHGIITLEPSPGRVVHFPLDQVEKANLKFEW